MRINSIIYILLACYVATFLRLFIENNIIVSIIGSFFFGFVINKRLSNINEKIHKGEYKQKDIWVMGFHPDDDVNELIDDGTFSEIVKEEYALIFVQRLTKLQESANKLKKLGYYDNYYNSYDVEDIYEQRENYYRRLKWQ